MVKTTRSSSVEEWLDSIDPATVEMRDGSQLRAIGEALDAL
jgi:hypothetical protein